MSGSRQDRLERFSLEVDRDEADEPIWLRQTRDTGALVALRREVIDLEHLHARKLGHAPCATVVAGAEDDELSRAGGDRIADGMVNRRRSQGDHIGHCASGREAHASLAFSSEPFGFCEVLCPFLAEKRARRRVAEVGNVREPNVGHRSAEGDEMSGATRTFSFHNYTVFGLADPARVKAVKILAASMYPAECAPDPTVAKSAFMMTPETQ